MNVCKNISTSGWEFLKLGITFFQVDFEKVSSLLWNQFSWVAWWFKIQSYCFLGGHIVLIRQMIFSSYNMGFYWACIKVSKSQKHFYRNSKKRTKHFTKFCPCFIGQNFVEYFVHFLGNGVSRKNAFEIYWPLKGPAFTFWLWMLLVSYHGLRTHTGYIPNSLRPKFKFKFQFQINVWDLDVNIKA